MLQLCPLQPQERDDFILRNQQSFLKAAEEHFGPQSRPVISREDILASLDADGCEAFSIVQDGTVIGGAAVRCNRSDKRSSLELLFLDPQQHNSGIGYAVWQMLEQHYAGTAVWETHTPYFDTRNIHFYVNKCGFHIVEFFNPVHPDPHEADTPGGELFFRFEKQMPQGAAK